MQSSGNNTYIPPTYKNGTYVGAMNVRSDPKSKTVTIPPHYVNGQYQGSRVIKK